MGIFDIFSRRPRVHQVSPEQAWTLVDQGAQFIDVRGPREYKDGHAVGTKNIPLDQIPRRLGRLDRNKAVVCICATGIRSSRAARAAAKQGLTAYNVKGGSRRWRAAGLSWRS